MAVKRTTLGGLIPVAFQAMALNDGTAVSLNSTIRASASVLDISIETQTARFRADSTDPTLNTGVLLATGYYRWQGFNGTSNLKFQRTTGTCNISIMAWRHAGGDR